jgi:CDP-diacylglycerol--glycerol-3-phosphate 3-phosphatidyltransferase
MADGTVRTTAAQARTSVVLPRAVLDRALWCLDHVARALIALGVTANAITLFSVVLAAVGGVLLAFGHFGYAAIAMVVASLGDALDGLVARRTRTASVGGALLDASVDRYEEFFFLGGLAVFFRQWPVALVLTLFALAGSFMISYGSAKAEALGVAVPPSAMRRAERAVCLCGGALLATPCDWVARSAALPDWLRVVPVLVALGLIAVVANVSAILRLRALARMRAHAPLVSSPADAPKTNGVAHPHNGVAHNGLAGEDDADEGAPASEAAHVVAAPHALRTP